MNNENFKKEIYEKVYNFLMQTIFFEITEEMPQNVNYLITNDNKVFMTSDNLIFVPALN